MQGLSTTMLAAVDEAAVRQQRARRTALTMEARRSVERSLKEFAEAACAEALRSLPGSEPLRVNLRVSVKKPASYYAAAEEVVSILLIKHHWRDLKIKDLLPLLFAEAGRRVHLAEPLPESYWKTPLNPLQLKPIHATLERLGFCPERRHDRLSRIADLIKAGPEKGQQAADRPTGTTTALGRVAFESAAHVHYLGERYLVRWRRGKPFVRFSDHEHNLYTLLGALGIGADTIGAWIANAEHYADLRKLEAEAERQWQEATEELGPVKADECGTPLPVDDA